MITDLKSEIKFLRDQVASKDTYYHEEIKVPRQQFETALSKQEYSNITVMDNIYLATLLTLMALS